MAPVQCWHSVQYGHLCNMATCAARLLRNMAICVVWQRMQYVQLMIGEAFRSTFSVPTIITKDNSEH